ncbi:MAG: glycosyltransferase family 39 protein [Bacteroidales bacterium]|nr:glycosyltransferase family 39 protein [Bacteroidales bacterium]MDD4238816.1 glycosyltransferase family 39 protein [Desulfotomaculaceae bacterium]
MDKKLPLEKKYLISFLVITAIGSLLRYYWIINIPNIPESDFEGYHIIATNIFNNLGFTQWGNPVAFQGMGYPLILGLFFKLAGNAEVLTGKYLNLLFSISTMVVLFFIFNKLFVKKTAIAAYLIVALLPNYIAYNSVLGTEILFTFFVALTILVQFSEFDNRLRYLLLGILIAFAALTKPYFIAYPAVFAIAEWVRSKSVKQTVIAVLAVSLIMTVIIAPWTYRNWRIFNEFVPISYNSGYVLYINNNDFNYIGGWMDPNNFKVSEEFKAKFVEKGTIFPEHPASTEKLYKDEATKWIFANPIEFLKLGAIRIGNTFFNGAQDIEKWTMNEFIKNKEHLSAHSLRKLLFFRAITDIIIYVLSSFGLLYTIINLKHIVISIFQKRSTIGYRETVVALNITFIAAIYFVTEGQPRYNFPSLFFLVIATVACIEAIVRNFNGSINFKKTT